MKYTELSIIILYVMFCIILGIWAQRKISSSNAEMANYYAAGRNIGTVANSLAILAALGSGGSFMAGPGTVWQLGIPFLSWMTVGSIVGFALASILVAKPLRNSRKVTVTEFLNDRYSDSKAIKIAVPIVIIMGSGMYLMSQMKAGGLITSYVTGLSYEWGVVIIALVFILYVSMGGMLAVTWTNLLQGLLMIIIVLSLIIAGIIHLPVSWIDFFNQATTQNQRLGNVGATVPVAGYLGAFVTWATAVSITPHLVMRIFTSTNSKSAKLSLNISMLIYGILMLGLVFLLVPFIGTLGESLLQNNPSDMWLLLIAETFFGPIIMGIIAAGIMAAVMSSTDSLLLAISSAIAYDLYKGVVNTEADQQKTLKVSMIATWFIGLVIMLLTLNPPQYLVVLYTGAVGFMVACLFSPMVLGIWWKKANVSGAVSGIIVGGVSFLIAFFLFEMPYNSEILVSLPLSLVVTMVVSNFTEKPSEETLLKLEMYHKKETYNTSNERAASGVSEKANSFN
ncbi:sodium/pantothenate symporter/cation/acetate symporter [Salinibacillus kushneri]|uniref:Sodium/pantothenate symporter/cation/acetate symporter n=1 Tax=Salinibacillus kushneri TaxID=237682 RepID=A0A1H9Y4T4_9BACI|nr:sodium:solute symporter family protein [Salinibacillus kushneri]SES63777.1 sodium/pantothenate symporter/cation/acetate symporter [Salinibacillus kushneri]